MLLLLSPFSSAIAEQAGTSGPTSPSFVSLDVAVGTPLRLYLTRRVWFHQGAPITARIIDPVWAFDREVIPAGTLAHGNVASLLKVSRLTRARAMLGGDFTPLKRAEISFSSLDFAAASANLDCSRARTEYDLCSEALRNDRDRAAWSFEP